MLSNLALQQAVGLVKIINVDFIGQFQLLKLIVDLLLLPHTIVTVTAIGCLTVGFDTLVLEALGEFYEPIFVHDHAAVLIKITLELQTGLAAEAAIQPAISTVGTGNAQPTGDEVVEAGGIFMFLGVELDLLEQIILVLEIAPMVK